MCSLQLPMLLPTAMHELTTGAEWYSVQVATTHGYLKGSESQTTEHGMCSLQLYSLPCQCSYLLQCMNGQQELKIVPGIALAFPRETISMGNHMDSSEIWE